MSDDEPRELDVIRAGSVPAGPVRHHWLVRALWTHQAVGVIGGPPKCCKTWLGLDIALSVASGTNCLGRFAVESPGPVLVYLAEDSLPAVRQRIEAIAKHRGLALEELDLFVGDAPRLRLDDLDDRRRLQATLTRLRPRLLLLDPLVRMHTMDENSSADISRLLGFLRELQRRFELAVVLVHHMAKRQERTARVRHCEAPATSTLGPTPPLISCEKATSSSSSSNIAQRQLQIRFASELVPSDDGLGAHLEVALGQDDSEQRPSSLTDAVICALSAAPAPMTRTTLRARLRVNNQRLGDALGALEQCSIIERTADGWKISQTTAACSTNDQQLSLV